MALESHHATAARTPTGGTELLRRLVRPVAARRGTLGVGALVDLGVGIPKLDRNVPLKLVLEPHRLHPGNRLHKRRLSVRHMSNRPNVDRSLARNHVRRQRRQLVLHTHTYTHIHTHTLSDITNNQDNKNNIAQQNYLPTQLPFNPPPSLSPPSHPLLLHLAPSSALFPPSSLPPKPSSCPPS